VHHRPRSPSSPAWPWNPRQAFLIPFRNQGTVVLVLCGRWYWESPTPCDAACRAFSGPVRPSWSH
jgi:hypothetical protein